MRRLRERNVVLFLQPSREKSEAENDTRDCFRGKFHTSICLKRPNNYAS
jgi:hypothetical protein